MSITTAPFYDLLVGDAVVLTYLQEFNGRANIFTYQPVPKGVVGTYIITAGEIVSTPNDSKDVTGRRITRDIRCYAPADGNNTDIEALAERVRTLFHRGSIVIPGFKTIYVNVNGPIPLDEEYMFGRVLTVDLLLSEL